MTTQTSTDTNANPDNQEQPKEVKAAQLTPEQQMEWGNEMTIEEPTVKTEDGKTFDPNTTIPTRAQLEATKAEEETKTEEEKKTPPPVTDDEDEDGVDTGSSLEDPGAYTPADYSFEVTILTGEEGKEKPKVVKITTPEEADKLLEEDPNFGTAKNLLDFNRKVLRMETKLEQDKQNFDSQKAAYEEQSQVEQVREQMVENTVREMNYLIAKGNLPPIAEEYMKYKVDWRKPDVAKQPGVKEALALIDYMNKENDARTKAGITSQMGPLDAYNAMMNDENEQKKIAAGKQAGEARKVAGAKVAGPSPAPVTGAPKGIAVGRGGSLRDLGQNWDF